MGARLDLHALLKALAGEGWNVYFVEPETVAMEYPCIRYERDYRAVQHANGKPYTGRWRYLVTVIDYDEESDVLEKIAALPLCVFDRHFTAENLNHDTFQLYF